jgi:hypothetical protein
MFQKLSWAASKALTIVLYRIMKTQQLVSYPAAVRSLVLSFRVALLLLSAACSVMYLANMLDRPQLEAVRAEDLRHLEQEHMARITHLREEHEAERAETARSIRERYRHLVQEAEERYLPAIRVLEESLSREMGNAVKGEFAGRRYRELERRLKEEKAAFEQRTGRLGEEEARESSRLDDLTERYRKVTTKVEQDYQKRRQILLANSYAGDARVENPTIHAFLSVLDAVLGLRLETLKFVFFFSLFLSVVIELGIVVAFENLTLARLPIFTIEHEVALNLGQKRITTEGKLQGFELDELLNRGKVRQRRENVERRMGEALTEALK